MTEDTVKTTIRLPADLHWQFQGERAKRRLSNEKALSEALTYWISHTQPSIWRLSKRARSRGSRPLPAEPLERECVEMLLDILRDSEHPARASAITGVLRALAILNREEDLKETRRRAETTRSRNRVGAKKA